MMNDTDIDKIIQRQENGNVYFIHVIANSQNLFLEIQDKMKGDIWSEQFSSQKIQQLTLKAKSPKKYTVFIKMLMSSLLGQTQSVLIQILTYSQLQRKMNLPSRGRNVQNNKKFVIMTYVSQFDKNHYPLGLTYQQNPPIQRLKVTIRRLSQQLTLNGQERSYPKNSDVKQLSMLRYQNETLKARIKALQQKLHQSSQGQNIMNKSNLLLKEQSQTQKQLLVAKNSLQLKQSQIQQLKLQNRQLQSQNTKKMNLIIDLKQQISEYKEDKINKRQEKQTFQLLQQKINQMNKQTAELISELQHSREQEKISGLKIENLQKQLQKMMNMRRKGAGVVQVNKGNQNGNNLNLSRKSLSQKSQKSYNSEKSRKSNTSNSKLKSGLQAYLSKNTNQNNSSKKIPTKRSSVYDSDTQSSKLRKANNRVSPFRQTTTNINNKVSGNKSNTSKKSNNSKNFSNTVHNNRFDRNILANGHDRSRSKSRSVKKQNSPPVQIPTDNFASSSSEDQKNITQALTKLKERKNRVKLTNNDSRMRNQQEREKNVMGPLQKKITNIAQMLRKAKSREGRQ